MTTKGVFFTPKEIEEKGLEISIVHLPERPRKAATSQLRIRGNATYNSLADFDMFPLDLKQFDFDLFRKFFETPLFEFKRIEIIEMILSCSFEEEINDLFVDFVKIMKSFEHENQIKFILGHMKLFLDIVDELPLEIKWTLLVASLNTQKYS